MARNLDRIQELFRQLSRKKRAIITVFALCFITYGEGVPSLRTRLYPLMDWLVVAGAAWLVNVALCSVWMRSCLLSRIPQYLGRISYSLYLIHGTVLFALVHLLYPRMPLIAIFPAYLATALVVASGFNSFVEEPCMKLGRQGGRIVAAVWTRLIPETNRA